MLDGDWSSDVCSSDLDFADEMRIKLEKTDDPTKLADELFGKLRSLA
jgi:hypothetical protein